MLVNKSLILAVAVTASLTTGCAPSQPVWQQEAKTVCAEARSQGGGKVLPEEFRSVEDAIVKGEGLLLEKEGEEADVYFHLAWTKGKLLEANLKAEEAHRAEAAKLKAEAERREAERQKAVQEEQKRLLQVGKEAAEALERDKNSREKAKADKEKLLPAYHTVMHGETLPQIAARSDIYSDQALWPLLYRANRDQIRDPRHVWPGQLLRIPRNMSREEIAEARRFGQEKSLH